MIHIHSELEYDLNEDDKKISFLGVSNWSLDSSKMNRGITINIPDPNEEDIQNCLGIPLGNFSTPAESYKNLCESVKKAFPNVRIVAVTLRRSYSADRNGWGAVLHGQTGFYESALYDIENIVERVGAGDSFAAGLIFALTTDENKEKKESHALEFAAAASCLKHSINGDFNLATKSEVELLMKGNGTGRIQR